MTLILSSLWWIVGTAGGATLAFLGSRRLARQLFFFVPLAGEVTILLCHVSQHSFSIRLLAQPQFWALLGMMYICGLVLLGGWVILLGELGWMIVSRASLSSRLSSQILVPAAAVTGGMVGYFNLISWHAFGQTYLPSLPVWVSSFQEFWNDAFSIAGLIGGALAGVLVAYSSLKESPSKESSLAHVQAL